MRKVQNENCISAGDPCYCDCWSCWECTHKSPEKDHIPLDLDNITEEDVEKMEPRCEMYGVECIDYSLAHCGDCSWIDD